MGVDFVYKCGDNFRLEGKLNQMAPQETIHVPQRVLGTKFCKI
jgi:hypothetical protein